MREIATSAYKKSSIGQNLKEVQARIAEAALRAGRDPDDVTLVAVSKMFPIAAILTAWEAGQREFGENRPEDGAERIPKVEATLREGAPTWHMIGHIQRRKARMVVEHFDVVHSIDRGVLAEKLSRLAVDAGREIPVLLECNVSGEASKYGYDLSGWENDSAIRDAFFEEAAKVLALAGLRVEGLMTMAPIVDDPEEARPVFASLRALGEALRERFPQSKGLWPEVALSMGMTDDFEVAVEEGATLVRIGRAIFGERI
jgi:hypothetical protein